jgi:uncharacterized oxidoreductase
MKTTGNTVLVTGGSAGIGFEIVKILSDAGNKVIITGRNEVRLREAAAKLKNVTPIISDVSDKESVNEMVATLTRDFPGLNVVINNAGKAFLHSLSADTGIAEKAAEEINTNYLAIIRLNEKLLPLLSKGEEAAIVNVSSIVAFVPNYLTSTYGASKAALHSYTQSLRIALAKSTSIKVFELMPPLVNTDFSQEIGGANGIPAKTVAEDLINALANDEFEIHVGRTAQLFELFHASTSEALLAMNPD